MVTWIFKRKIIISREIIFLDLIQLISMLDIYNIPLFLKLSFIILNDEDTY